MSRDLLHRLNDTDLVALRVEGDAWPRSLLSDTRIPDAWMGLVETRDGRRRFVPAGEDPRPDPHDRLLLVRNRAITVALSLADCSAACGNTVEGTCDLLLRWPARDDELAALSRSLLAQGRLTLQRLSQAVVEAGGRAALQEFIRQQPAAVLVRQDVRESAAAALRERLKRSLFEWGAELERVARLALTSESLERQEARQRQLAEQVERIQARELVEAAARAATQKRLDYLGTLLQKLQSAAAAADSSGNAVQWHALLPALTAAERGRLLENLWRITPDRNTARAIVLVAGDVCAWLDPHTPDAMERTITLPGDLGGLRAISYWPQQDRLLVGAATGVWLLDAADGNILARYVVKEPGQPQTGFNSATIVGRRLFASHSQLGCWMWPLDAPDAAEAILRPSNGSPRAIRAVTATDDGRVVFSADACVHVHDGEGRPLRVTMPARATIHGLAVLDEDVFAGTADGMLVQDKLDGSQDVWMVLHRSLRPIESVQVRRWNDLVELVIPAGVQGVCGVYASEGVVTRLLDSPTPIRKVWACDDALVALNDNRDRLVITSPSSPERGGHPVAAARMLGSSVQDVCIVVSQKAGTPASAANA